MKKTSSLFTAGLGLLILLSLLGGCGKKRPPVLSQPPATTGDAEGDVRGDDGGEGSDVQPLSGDSLSGSDLASSEGGGPLADVPFEYDSAAITAAAQQLLASHARWLNDHPRNRVTLEGHCDERGTVEYNLALGEQRSRAVYDYLTSLGIDGSRFRTVSFGAERPLDSGHGESAWAKNRRVHFVVGN
jgi:peptidoglycan-associated lipoprotein